MAQRRIYSRKYKKSRHQYKSKSIVIYDFIDLWIPKIIETETSIALF